jgi:hypothetical protein
MPRIKIEGIRELKAALNKYRADAGKAFRRGCAEAAQMLLDNTEELVPLDTGALRASGDFFQEEKGWQTVTSVGYGFPVSGYLDANGLEKNPSYYAVDQHETLWYNHNYGQALYLQAGVDREIGEISNIITTHIIRL